ncbi:MAG: hypothetical protein Q4P06_02620 [Actinomycetaceae bacterium]|nr:hypothetical protein [Actinomycetaceae bacterium]
MNAWNRSRRPEEPRVKAETAAGATGNPATTETPGSPTNPATASPTTKKKRKPLLTALVIITVSAALIAVALAVGSRWLENYIHQQIDVNVRNAVAQNPNLEAEELRVDAGPNPLLLDVLWYQNIPEIHIAAPELTLREENTSLKLTDVKIDAQNVGVEEPNHVQMLTVAAVMTNANFQELLQQFDIPFQADIKGEVIEASWQSPWTTLKASATLQADPASNAAELNLHQIEAQTPLGTIHADHGLLEKLAIETSYKIPLDNSLPAGIELREITTTNGYLQFNFRGEDIDLATLQGASTTS